MTNEQVQEAIRNKTTVYWYGNAYRVIYYVRKRYYTDYVIIERIMNRYSQPIEIEPAFLSTTREW